MLSAVILAKNEERCIVHALQSVTFCDEIIVLDDLSTDKTAELASQQGARVIEHELSGDFAAQRNLGLEAATNKWVLFLDADEVIPESLQKEIKTVVSQEKADIAAYRILRDDYWCGSVLRRGELHKAAHQGIIRLVRCDAGIWKGAVHEEFQTMLKVGTLEHSLKHFPHPTLTEFILDVNNYSTLRAQELYDQSYPFSLFELLIFPPVKFCYTYFLRRGFLDGAPGFVYAFLMSFHSFLVRAKLFQYYLSGINK